MMYLLRPCREGKDQRTVKEAARMLSYILIDQWEFCTVYTVKVHHVHKKVEKLYSEFINYVRTRTPKQTNHWRAKVNIFNQRRTELFDIFAGDDGARKKMELQKGVPMGPDEWLSYKIRDLLGRCTAMTFWTSPGKLRCYEANKLKTGGKD